MTEMHVEFLPCGDAGLSVQFGDRIDRSLNERVIRIKAGVDEARIAGVIETVPTYRALMIHYDPLQTSQASLIDALGPLLHQDYDNPLRATRWRIPACYEPEFALDLKEVAEWAGMTTEQVIEIHTSVVHYVYMLGFAPGQPHMGDLPDALAIPRRRDPRPRIDKGSIVTATGLTIIYPVANACGWHIIGRSPISVFDPGQVPPALLNPGDTVEFFPISAAEFQDIRERADVGLYRIERQGDGS